MPTMLNFDLPLDQLKNYRGSSLRPADFDSYWEQALDELHQLEQAGLEPEWQTAAFQLPFAQCRELYFNGVGGARVHARCVFPKSQNNGQNKPFPAVFRFHRYNGSYTGSAGDWSPLLPYAASGFAVFAMDVRGQGGQSTDPGGFAGNTLEGHVTRGLESGPKGLLYRRIFLDTAAIVHLAAGLAEIDETEWVPSVPAREVRLRWSVPLWSQNSLCLVGVSVSLRPPSCLGYGANNTGLHRIA